MDNFRASEVFIKPLQNTFLIDLEGHSVIALKLASKVAKQISGQENDSGGHNFDAQGQTRAHLRD